MQSPQKIGPSIRFSRHRAAALLFVTASLGTVWIGLLPHVALRVPLALIAAWGLWKHSRWGFTVALIAAFVWLGMTVLILPFLFVASPWVLWLQWLYWGGPAVLVITAIALLSFRAGREERRKAKDLKR